MAERPSFQFYPADWRGNAKLQRCSPEARGAWIDVMCLLHDADEYGVLRWPLADIASAVRLPLKVLRELATKGVLKGADSGGEDYTYTPFHAGKHGAPVTLVAVGAGPCWYCSRFVKDEWRRQNRGKATRFSDTNPPPNKSPKPTPTHAPTHAVGEWQGDGSSSASASSVNQELPVPTELAGSPKPVDSIWDTGKAFLIRKGVDAKQAGAFLGKLRKEAGDVALIALLADAQAQDVSDPIPWLAAAARNAQARKAKPSAADDFRGKSYESTPDDQLPESLR